jgi:hypothetical protein
MLLAQLLGQVELATVAAEAGGLDAAAVARGLGTVTPARISAVMASEHRRRPRPESSAVIGVLTDRRLKTGRTRRPEEALQELLLSLGTQQTGRSA